MFIYTKKGREGRGKGDIGYILLPIPVKVKGYILLPILVKVAIIFSKGWVLGG